MVLRGERGPSVEQTRTRTRFNSYRMRLLCGIACLIVALAATVHPALPADPEPRPINDLVKFLDIQIPGWQREGNPTVVPVLQKGTTMVTLIIVNFHTDEKHIKIYLIIPAKQTVDQTMARVTKEYAQPIKVKGFPAIKVTPPVTEYDKYDSSLSINVADRYVIALLAEEVLNPDTLVKVADLIDLKKLAATPQNLTKK